MTRALVAAWICLYLLVVPRVAEACPSCANNDKGGIAAGVLIGTMIVLPFSVVALVVRLIRKHS